MKIIQKTVDSGGTVYKPSAPFNATILENERITGDDSADDIRHITIDIQDSGILYKEGQSIGILAPGENEKGKRHRPRLYSIASPRGGESSMNTIALTIKRVLFTDPDTGKEVRGLASNYTCDLKPGEQIQITGPVGRTFLLPEDDHTDLIMVAVGTGIAPFRAFIHHIYRERRSWQGKVLLFFGAKTGLESLYMNDKNSDISQYYDEETFTAFQALSQEGSQQYVQDKMQENREELWKIIKDKNFSFYLCGLRGVEDGVTGIFSDLAAAEGLDWSQMQAAFKEEGRWHIEVY